MQSEFLILGLSAALKEFGKLLFGEFQFTYTEVHGTARDSAITVWFMEGHNRWVALNIYEISRRTTLFVCGWTVSKFASYAQQLCPGQMRWELHHSYAMQTNL